MRSRLSFPILVNYINLISVLCLVFLFISSGFKFDRIALIVFFVSYIIEIFTDKKIQNFKLNKTTIYFLIMLFFFVLAILYIPFENGSNYTNLLLEKRTSLLAFGIVGLLGVNHLYNLKFFLYTFVFTSVITIIYILFKADIYTFIANANRAELFAATRIKYVNGHMIFNFYMNISILSIWVLLKNYSGKFIFLYYGLLISALLIIVTVLYHTDGRSGFTASILIMLSIAFYEIISRKRIIGIVFLFIIPIIIMFVAGNHKRMSENAIKSEPRIFLWKSGLNVVAERPIIGHGINDAQVAFDGSRKKYQDVTFESYTANLKHVDCHNQYIQTTMEFGIIGLSILLFLYIYPAFVVDKEMRLFSILVLALCMYQSVFDMFATGSFSFIFAFLMLMLLRSYLPKADTELS